MTTPEAGWASGVFCNVMIWLMDLVAGLDLDFVTYLLPKGWKAGLGTIAEESR